MKRVIAVMCCALVARTVSAQGSVGGFAYDQTTESPLACIDVQMLRDDSTVVAKTRTLPGGAFRFPAPPAGRYRQQFGGFGVSPALTPFDSLSPTTEQDRVYRLSQSPLKGTEDPGYKDTDPDAPPYPRDPKSSPRFPKRILEAMLEGNAVVRYLVDSTGKVDPRSIQRLLGSDHALFASIRSWLVQTPFVPGRRDHRPVCDLLVQEFAFRIR